MKQEYVELMEKCDRLCTYNDAINKLLEPIKNEKNVSDDKQSVQLSGEDRCSSKADLLNNVDKGNIESIQRLIIGAYGKAFHHDLIIVNLYSIIEWFTEQIIETYIKDLSKMVNKFSDLPKDICDNHVELSVDLLKNTKRMPKYQGLNTNDIIKNMYACAFDNQDFLVNKEAFTYHSANLRKDAISGLFKKIGFENIMHSIKENKSFQQTIMEIDGLDEFDIARYDEDMYFSKLMDIVERRNKIAHGAFSDDRIELDQLGDYIRYTTSFLTAMYTEVYKEYLRQAIHNHKCTELGFPEKTFPKKNVIAFRSNNLKIKIKQLLVGYNESTNNLTYGVIQSLRKETADGDLQIEETDESENAIIGISAEAEVKERYKYFIYK